MLVKKGWKDTLITSHINVLKISCIIRNNILFLNLKRRREVSPCEHLIHDLISEKFDIKKIRESQKMMFIHILIENYFWISHEETSNVPLTSFIILIVIKKQIHSVTFTNCNVYLPNIRWKA